MQGDEGLFQFSKETVVCTLNTYVARLKIKVNSYGYNVIKFRTMVLKYGTLAQEVLHCVAEQ